MDVDNFKPSSTLSAFYVAVILLGVLLAGGTLLPLEYLAVGAVEAGRIVLGFISSFSSSPVFNNFILVVFWGAVGLLCYGTYLRLANALIWAQNQATIEVGFTNQGARSHWAQVYLWPVISFLALITLTALTWKLTWPLWRSLWEVFWSQPGSPNGIVKLAAGILGAFINLHLLALTAMARQLKKPR